jgi:SP family arabinose:H+ symporter-like MFS transporter
MSNKRVVEQSNDTTITSDQDQHKQSAFLVIVVTIAALGGLLFGYDQGVISGAINFLQTNFHMSNGLAGFVSGSIPLGAMVGCLIAGFLSDKVGRKLVLFIAGLLFVIGSLSCALAGSVAILIVGRLIGGLGVGMASTLVPLYISEIAPVSIRGRLVGAYQLAVASGMFIVYIVNAIIANTHTVQWNQLTGWRWMFAAGAIPGILFFILLFLVPESPRYLVKKGDQSQARAVLTKIVGSKEAEIEVNSIKQSIVQDGNGSLSLLFKKGFRAALIIALVLAVMQQFTGVSAVAYYAPLIFQQTGMSTNASLVETIVLGAVKVAFVFGLMALIDRGRKRLLLYGSAVMAVCLFILGIIFTSSSFNHIVDILILAMVLIHTIAFELSWGGGVWIVISEIFPTSIRGRATSIASATLWLATYVVTQLFPMMLHGLGGAPTFAIFGVFCVIMFLFTLKWLPETKGKSLEEIQAYWASK